MKYLYSEICAGKDKIKEVDKVEQEQDSPSVIFLLMFSFTFTHCSLLEQASLS